MKIVKIDSHNEAIQTFHNIGVDPYGIRAMAPKTRHLNILLSAQSCKVANILKQEMLSLGADAAVARGSVACSIPVTDVLLMGTGKQITNLARKIEKQPFGLASIATELLELMEHADKNSYVLKTARREINLGERTLIMGILNVTPDSFSDGNCYLDPQKAVLRAMQMADEGADIIDIGGESTRPGSKPVTARQECARVIPIVESLSKRLSIPISVDTTKAAVAEKSLASGAEIINDISSLSHDKKMASVIRKANAALILMHMRGTPEHMQNGNLTYEDLMGEIIAFLTKAGRKAQAAGIDKDHLVADPGIGFGKTYQDNCRIIKKLQELKVLGLPLLVGTSRKAFIGRYTGGEEPAQRVDGTAATVAAAIMNGCHIVRVHDVARMKKIAAMTDAIVHAQRIRMIYGIGIDLVENERIEKIIEKWGDKFLSRVFSEREIAYCARHALASLHYGARFAVKESFLKAIGTGMGRGIKLQEIEVVNQDSGKPEIQLSGGAREYLEKEAIERVHLSITHTKNYASAIVLLEK